VQSLKILLLFCGSILLQSCITQSVLEQANKCHGARNDELIKIYSSTLDSNQNLRVVYKALLHNNQTPDVYAFRVNLKDLIKDSLEDKAYFNKNYRGLRNGFTAPKNKNGIQYQKHVELQKRHDGECMVYLIEFKEYSQVCKPSFNTAGIGSIMYVDTAKNPLRRPCSEFIPSDTCIGCIASRMDQDWAFYNDKILFHCAVKGLGNSKKQNVYMLILNNNNCVKRPALKMLVPLTAILDGVTYPFQLFIKSMLSNKNGA
jgi:hypothetical protein